jgi:hypothetical protein
MARLCRTHSLGPRTSLGRAHEKDGRPPVEGLGERSVHIAANEADILEETVIRFGEMEDSPSVLDRSQHGWHLLQQPAESACDP